MYYTNFTNYPSNKYFECCIRRWNCIQDSHKYSAYTLPINIAQINGPKDLWEKYKCDKMYHLKNSYYQNYATQYGWVNPKWHPWIDNHGYHHILSIEILESLNLPLSSEYIKGIISLLMPVTV